MLKIESADGQAGYLIWCGGDRYVFRVYTQAPDDFTDYDILHTDVRVVIQDTDAYFYSDAGSNRLDHSPDTLGLKISE